MSGSIAISRVICILGIVYVHAWTGLYGWQLESLNHSSQGFLRWGLIDLLGRSSVPLLSVISGWLVGPSFARRGLRMFYTGKARAIVLPMVAWNALAIVFVSGAAALHLIEAPLPTTVLWTLNELLCLLKPSDINVQMPFLRDLFLCMLAVPLLSRLPDRGLIGISAVVAAWSISTVSIPLLLRPSILMFFIIGLLIRRHDLAERIARAPVVVAAGAYLVMAAAELWLEMAGAGTFMSRPAPSAALDLMMRAATANMFWALAWRLAGSRFAPALLRIEPYMFLLFCAHLIMIWLGGPLIGRLTGPMGSPLYPVLLLAQPLIVLGASVILGKVLLGVSPAAARLLSGGRLHRERQPRLREQAA
ncbi:acyltransferase family protein [Novosphingobium sp. 9]|uniref:acyltransferase family protein n=1 Tax=Novosphingobium sp. 9 TaxID=2025349 RepID=UPI0021B579BC|nr:acyltransferase [Novosphingobium sp. 9]